MLTAIIILSLLSLLVATEAEPGDAGAEPMHDDPLHRERDRRPSPEREKSERLAA